MDSRRVCQSVCQLVSYSITQWCLRSKVDAKARFNKISRSKLFQMIPNTIIFSLSHFSPGTVSAETVQADFTASLGYFQDITTKKKTSFTSFFLWPCNLFPSFFPLSSMVSHTEEQRSKKEVNEFELPFERRKLSLLSLHLIRSGCCFWVSHSHRRKTLIFSLACCLIFYSRSLSSLSLTIWKNITFWMVPALLFEATLVACDSLDILFFSPSNP